MYNKHETQYKKFTPDNIRGRRHTRSGASLTRVRSSHQLGHFLFDVTIIHGIELASVPCYEQANNRANFSRVQSFTKHRTQREVSDVIYYSKINEVQGWHTKGRVDKSNRVQIVSNHAH